MSEQRQRILIVDDDRDFSESMAAFLRAHGYDVAQAWDGSAGAEAARRQRPDLILMDVMMRERTEGFFTVQQIRRDPLLRTIPVFIVSSLYTQIPGFRVLPERDWTGHDEFFPKPVEMDRLLATIARYLAGARAGTPEAAVAVGEDT